MSFFNNIVGNHAKQTNIQAQGIKMPGFNKMSAQNPMAQSMHSQASRSKCMDCPKEVLDYIQTMRRDFYQAKNILTGFSQTDQHGHLKQHLQSLNETKEYIIREVSQWFEELHAQMEAHHKDNNVRYADKVTPISQEVDYNIQMLDQLEQGVTKYENMEPVHQVMHMMLYDDANTYDPDVTMEKVNNMVEEFVQGQYAVSSDHQKIQQIIQQFKDCVCFEKIDGKAFMQDLERQRTQLDAKGMGAQIGQGDIKSSQYNWSGLHEANHKKGGGGGGHHGGNKFSQPQSNFGGGGGIGGGGGGIGGGGGHGQFYQTPSPSTNRQVVSPNYNTVKR